MNSFEQDKKIEVKHKNTLYDNVETNIELLQAMVETEELIRDKDSRTYNNFQEIRDELGV